MSFIDYRLFYTKKIYQFIGSQKYKGGGGALVNLADIHAMHTKQADIPYRISKAYLPVRA